MLASNLQVHYYAPNIANSPQVDNLDIMFVMAPAMALPDFSIVHVDI